LGANGFKDEQRVCDHPWYFRLRTGQPVAIVYHSYAPPALCRQFAEKAGLRYEVLPDSWHAPRFAHAFVLRRLPQSLEAGNKQ
jgi:hypothetical protein